MDSTITLECWVYGDDVNSIFPIKISRTETVGVLKEAIKEKATVRFHGVDAKDIQLYTIPSPDDNEDELKRWTSEDKPCLNPRAKLFKLFSNSDEREYLIIADGPSSGLRATADIVPVMTLYCWARGQQMNRIFPVEISSSETIASLQEVIKGKKPVYFRDLDADALALYKVSLSHGDVPLEGVLGHRTISSLGRRLQSSQKLSAVFTSIHLDDQLHLVVEGSVPFRCWFRGADPANSFEVQVSMRTSVDDLKNVIKTALKDFHYLSPDRLGLYKFQEEDEPELHDVLGSPGLGRLLQGNELLEELFNDVPFSRTPRVVIELLDQRNDDRIKIARATFLTSAIGDEFPNTGTLLDYEEPVPIALLHPVFGDFLDDCENIAVTAEDNALTSRLSRIMSDFYDNKHQRFRAVSNQFLLYNIHFTASETGCLADANISVNGHHYVVVEVHNEIGDMPPKPYSKAQRYYLESTRESALKFTRSPLPCLLVAVFGPIIHFVGVGWNLCPVAQFLSTPIHFHFHLTDTRSHLTAARHLAAFRKATESLKEYYKKLQETPLPTSMAVRLTPQLFPHPRSYTHGNSVKTFQYMRQPDPGRLIFLGVEDKTLDHICIKFVRDYSPEAHNQLASLGCTPTLRGFEKVIGNWFMVVMDAPPHNFERLSDHKGLLPSRVFDDMFEKLASFHEADYVHGDIHDANIMVSKSDEKRFMIVNLDWAGKVGKAWYSFDTNDGVERPLYKYGEKIPKEHDLYMLKRVRELKCME